MNSDPKPNTVRTLGPLQIFLLTVPCVAVLAVPWFNILEPSAFGIPFFYWYQLLWILIGGALIGFVYWLES